MKNKFSIILCVIIILLFSSISMAAGLDKVDFLLDWVPNTNHTGIYVALSNGWYEEENIQLNIIEPAGNMSVEQVVGAGRADLGISFQEWMTMARVEGVPIVSLAAVIQHNTSGFAAMASSNIKRPLDFTDKTYGGFGNIEKEILRSLINGDGGDYDKLNFINIGQGDLLTMLARGEFDFTWIYYAWQGIQAEMRGMDINVIMLKDYKHLVPDYYTPVIISSEKFIENNPLLLQRFMKATSRGYNYAVQHPEEAAAILSQYVPESDPELIVRSQRWLASRYKDDADYWGEQKLKVWKDFGEWMYNHKLIQKKFKPESAFTNDFLPGENN